MPRGTTVPITGSVVAWAIRESGYSTAQLAEELGLPSAMLNDWSSGARKPGLTQMRALAAKLKRPLAVFLLPKPPESRVPAVEFRRSAASHRSTLNPEERRRLREAARIQRILSWMGREIRAETPIIPQALTSQDPTALAADVRDRLAVSVKDQVSWTSGSAALQGWREALEHSGVSTLMLSIGAESCRGFSLWEPHVPLIAVNTSWNTEARIFTLFHEYGHLLTRTNSACVEGTARRTATQSDSIERWCERFAAAVLLPEEALRLYVAQLSHAGETWAPDLQSTGRIARHFKVSLRAAALRLIELGIADWELYSSLPAQIDRKPASGGGGAGRTRSEARSDQYGSRTIGLFADALRRDVIGVGDVLDYLDIPPASLGKRSARGEQQAEHT